MNTTLEPCLIGGSVTIPSSKSQTIRALLIASFAQGTSIIHNPLDSQDTRSCMVACRAFGARITTGEPDNEGLHTLIVNGSGPPTKPVSVDCGNSGTTLYLAAGMAAAATAPVTFTGDDQLNGRPVGNLLRSLADLGAHIEGPTRGPIPEYPPFTVQGPLVGGTTTIACPTSQYLSSLLLGTPLAQGESSITVSLLHEIPYAYITLEWLASQGISIQHDQALSHIAIPGRQYYTPFEALVSGDFSSASFFFCAAAITGCTISVSGLDREDPQGDKHILDILQSMGCSVVWNESTVTVTGPPQGTLRSGHFDLNSMPDALPVLAVTACYAQGTTILGNVPQARIKETDRIAVMHKNLSSCGASLSEQEDALIIHGNGSLAGGVVDGYGDHRVIMAMAIASLGAARSITIQGIDAVDVTFPTFFTLLGHIKQYSAVSKEEPPCTI